MQISNRGVYTPAVDVSQCKACENCIKVCPGSSVDFNALNEFVFGRIPDSYLLGNFIECYTGHSMDEEIRWNASSGGLVTSLLVFLLKEGKIDGALVTKMSLCDPLEPEVTIATTEEEIRSASQSKYCPVPVSEAIKRILKENRKVAVVGLPCHIHGIRKAEMANSKIRERIILHIGLFCGHGVSFLGTEFILRKLAIDKKQVKRIDYRRFEYPGVMSVSFGNGNVKSFSHVEFWASLFSKFTSFSSRRCTLCSDATSEFADISFGTAWLPDLTGHKNSICLSRTKIGDEFLQLARQKKKIYLEEISCERVVQAEKSIIDFTKKKLRARLFVTRMLRKHVPDYYGLKLADSNAFDYVDALLLYLRMYLSSRKSAWKFLLRITPKIEARNSNLSECSA